MAVSIIAMLGNYSNYKPMAKRYKSIWEKEFSDRTITYRSLGFLATPHLFALQLGEKIYKRRTKGKQVIGSIGGGQQTVNCRQDFFLEELFQEI